MGVKNAVFDLGHALRGQTNSEIRTLGDKIVVSDRQSGLYVIDFILYNNFLLGDVNGDTNIDIFDVIIIVEFILNTESPDDQEFTLSDINLDQTIDVLDILMIIEVILS